MPTRTVTVPETISIKLQAETPNTKVEGVAYTFHEFILHLLLMPVWGQNRATAKAANAIDNAFESAPGGTEVELAEEDWQRLKDCVEKPANGIGLHPKALRQLLPYLDAICEATTAKHKKPKPREATTEDSKVEA